jgi:hypothetical protein
VSPEVTWGERTLQAGSTASAKALRWVVPGIREEEQEDRCAGWVGDRKLPWLEPGEVNKHLRPAWQKIKTPSKKTNPKQKDWW